jgi:hypothetical protein
MFFWRIFFTPLRSNIRMGSLLTLTPFIDAPQHICERCIHVSRAKIFGPLWHLDINLGVVKPPAKAARPPANVKLLPQKGASDD